MPQMQLPIFPEGSTHITSELAFEKRDGQVTYFNGQMPIFRHDEKDVPTFKMITAQFCCTGSATQVAIARAFGVPAINVKRSVKTYREKGPRGFYEPRPTRGPNVLTPEVLQQAQEKLDAGVSAAEMATELGLKRNTVQKAIRDGRLHEIKKKTPVPQVPQ
jgi:transposase-like protein